ncbi:hypothetical protein ABK040_009657 [Willaertia magna]
MNSSNSIHYIIIPQINSVSSSECVFAAYLLCNNAFVTSQLQRQVQQSCFLNKAETSSFIPYYLAMKGLSNLTDKDKIDEFYKAVLINYSFSATLKSESCDHVESDHFPDLEYDDGDQYLLSNDKYSLDENIVKFFNN